jgi:hypothetical protein
MVQQTGSEEDEVYGNTGRVESTQSEAGLAVVEFAELIGQCFAEQREHE